MTEKTRRTDEDLVKIIIKYLQAKKGTVSRGELCKDLDIHPSTAEKWLEIGILFIKKCPVFDYDKAGTLGIIKVKEMTKT